MRNKMLKKKFLRYAIALGLAVTLAVGCVLPAGAAAREETNSYVEYLQKVALYRMLGDSAAGLNYFEQLLQKDPGDLSAYLARGQMRQMNGDIAGARQDYDYAIDHLTDNVSENAEVRLYGYAVRSEVDFLQGDQAQYLADMQTNQNVMDLIFGSSIAMYPVEEGAQSWAEIKAQNESNQNALRSWYNNGNPAKSFRTEHASVSGGIGDTTIQINEAWNEEEIDTTYDTTFHLSQPVRNVTRKAPVIAETFHISLDADDSESGAVAYFVPAGTVVTMDQLFQSGKSRAKTYHSFRAEDCAGNEVFDGESLTVEAGKLYKLDYAGYDSLTVYFIAV